MGRPFSPMRGDDRAPEALSRTLFSRRYLPVWQSPQMRSPQSLAFWGDGPEDGRKKGDSPNSMTLAEKTPKRHLRPSAGPHALQLQEQSVYPRVGVELGVERAGYLVAVAHGGRGAPCAVVYAG